MKQALCVCLAVFSSVCQAQWVQSNLNSNLGRSLYSDGTTAYVGSSQGVYYTAGAGDPWISIGPANKDIFCVTTIGTKILAGSGGNGVFISTNTGQSWYQPPTLSGQTVYSFAKNSSYLFVGTWGGGVFRSSDNGETWEPAGLATKGIARILAVGGTLLAGSPDLYSKIYYSTDNGSSWGTGSLSYPASNIRSLYYDGSTLFACDAGLYASTDMGKTWQLRYGVTFDLTGYPIKTMLFRSMIKYNQFLLACVDFESVYRSSDNGFSWTPFNQGIISDWTFVDIVINGPYLWVVRDFFGNAYRRPLAELFTEVPEEGVTPDAFALAQNFPNPFNPTTSIGFGVAGPGSSPVKLAVYDLLGREVAVLVNERKEPGSYSVSLDASGLASGMYFYNLVAGEHRIIKKLTVLR